MSGLKPVRKVSYGEMEMRRYDRESGIAERGTIWLYWLDFSHLRAKRVGYARHRNQPKRGDRNSAYPTAQDGTGVGPLRATFLQVRLAPCPVAAGGSYPRSG